jgi:lysine 2,3-aminomutase
MKHDRTLRDAAGVVRAGLAPPERLRGLEEVARQYAVAITPSLAALIDPADAADPIARQFVPSEAELITSPGESADPIGDDAHSPIEGIVHRYPDRVLLKLVHICAVYCRFCFRRAMVGPGKKRALSPAALAAALDYVRSRPEIWEVILTGGDPLVLSPRRLREVMRALGGIEHVKVVRTHTRVPVADPARVTGEMVRALKAAGKASYVVLHANHPRELTDEARAACARFVDAGIPMLSQSVLLRGVNDDPETLGALLRAFVECRIKPYYLHHGDLAPGTGHLRTTIAQGQALMRQLQGRLSGLCQPAYVLDIPGGYGKAPIGPCYLDTAKTNGGYAITDYCGVRHRYRDEVAAERAQEGRNATAAGPRRRAGGRRGG